MLIHRRALLSVLGTGTTMTSVKLDVVPLFATGPVYMTQGTHHLYLENRLDVTALLRRHVTGDWQEMVPEDQQSNAEAVKEGLRVFSSFALQDCAESDKVWVITEADRSSTTILFPSEY